MFATALRSTGPAMQTFGRNLAPAAMVGLEIATTVVVAITGIGVGLTVLDFSARNANRFSGHLHRKTIVMRGRVSDWIKPKTIEADAAPDPTHTAAPTTPSSDDTMKAAA